MQDNAETHKPAIAETLDYSGNITISPQSATITKDSGPVTISPASANLSGKVGPRPQYIQAGPRGVPFANRATRRKIAKGK